MANTPSSKKRARQNEKRRTHNRYYRSTARTHVKRVQELIDKGDLKGAEEAIRLATQALDKAAQKGTIHANNASRRKSRLMLMLNKARAKAQPA